MNLNQLEILQFLQETDYIITKVAEKMRLLPYMVYRKTANCSSLLKARGV